MIRACRITSVYGDGHGHGAPPVCPSRRRRCGRVALSRGWAVKRWAVKLDANPPCTWSGEGCENSEYMNWGHGDGCAFDAVRSNLRALAAILSSQDRQITADLFFFRENKLQQTCVVHFG
jgi:hypothetical protein